jgi:hypothetical protein
MHLRWSQYAAGVSRCEDYRVVAAIGIFFGVYAGFAICFYWLMQPNVAANYGLAAYRPPPKTVVNYADLPWVPPAAVEPRAELVLAEPTHEIAESSVIEPTKEIKKPEAGTPLRRERRVRERPNPSWTYSSSRSYGFRPWF